MARKLGLPKKGEVVLCRVVRLTQFAAWCELLEYPAISGMIPIAEVAGKWVEDIKEYVKQGRHYAAQVMAVDEKAKHVDLSLRRVTLSEQKKAFDSYRKEQKAERILEQAANQLGKSLDRAYEEIGYALLKRFGSLSAALEQHLELLDLPTEWKKALTEVMERVMRSRVVTLKAELELSSQAGDGIVRIKRLLEQLEQRSGAMITYISAPRYLAELKTLKPGEDLKRFKAALKQLVAEAERAQVKASFKLE